MAYWKQFNLDLVKREENQITDNDKHPFPSEATIDLERVESFYRACDDNDQMDTITRVCMFSGDTFWLLIDYEKFKSIITSPGQTTK